MKELLDLLVVFENRDDIIISFYAPNMLLNFKLQVTRQSISYDAYYLSTSTSAFEPMS